MSMKQHRDGDGNTMGHSFTIVCFMCGHFKSKSQALKSCTPLTKQKDSNAKGHDLPSAMVVEPCIKPNKEHISFVKFNQFNALVEDAQALRIDATNESKSQV